MLDNLYELKWQSSDDLIVDRNPDLALPWCWSRQTLQINDHIMRGKKNVFRHRRDFKVQRRQILQWNQGVTVWPDEHDSYRMRADIFIS